MADRKCGCGGELKPLNGFFSRLVKGEVNILVCKKCGKTVKS